MSCFFHFPVGIVCRQKVLILTKTNFFPLLLVLSVSHPKRRFLRSSFAPMFSSKSFIVLALICRSLIHWADCVRWCEVGVQSSQRHLLERLFFPSLNCLGVFVEKKVTIRKVGFFFLQPQFYPTDVHIGLSFHPSVHPVPLCPDYRRKFRPWDMSPPALFFFFFYIF